MVMSRALVYLASLALSSALVNQVHITLSSEAVDCEDGVAITFASDVGRPLRVHYGIDTPDTVARTFPKSYYVNSANYSYTSLHLHTALLCKLEPDATYVYSGAFKSIPEANQQTILSIVGDIGMEQLNATLNNLGSAFDGQDPDAVIVVGDWSYANGCQEDWDKWFIAAETLFAKVPLLGINGNHEVIANQGANHSRPECPAEMYTAYLNRIITPISEEAKKDNRVWYSKNIGNIHAVFVDDYAGFQADPAVIGSTYWLNHRQAQFEWLEKDLSAVDRSKTPYVIVFKHNPYYNTFVDHQCQCSLTKFEIEDAASCWNGTYNMATTVKNGALSDAYQSPHCANQAKFEDLFMNKGVDAVIAGHVHAYERTAPIYKNKIVENGVVHITVGTGGHSLYEQKISPIPEWSEVTASIFGAARVVADYAKLTIEFRSNQETTKLFDFVSLPRRF
uniref:Purple acid phosphatase n=1 Tax=Thraustotheca clavata TaxID=74557 RepID=A0A0A7CLM2_9STRA|nr:secreted protein [Thraustotheca clavata]